MKDVREKKRQRAGDKQRFQPRRNTDCLRRFVHDLKRALYGSFRQLSLYLKPQGSHCSPYMVYRHDARTGPGFVPPGTGSYRHMLANNHVQTKENDRTIELRRY